MGYMRNFGHKSTMDFECVGINGKNSEFHAAMGMANLEYIDSILYYRKEQFILYKELLASPRLNQPEINSDSQFNYAYFPLIFETEEELLRAMDTLSLNWVGSRRYFYPSLNKVSYVNGNQCEICEDISRRVLCLPLYHDLSHEEIRFICKILIKSQSNAR